MRMTRIMIKQALQKAEPHLHDWAEVRFPGVDRLRTRVAAVPRQTPPLCIAARRFATQTQGRDLIAGHCISVEPPAAEAAALAPPCDGKLISCFALQRAEIYPDYNSSLVCAAF